MSRPVSLSARRALNAAETDEVFIILITIAHPSMAEPIRVCSDSGAVESRGHLFAAYPFDLSLPDDGEGGSPRARLSIDNVDRAIVRSVRALDSAPTVLIEIVRAAEPDVVEAKFADFKLVNVRYDAQAVRGDLTVEDFTAEPYPALVFGPGDFPGLF